MKNKFFYNPFFLHRTQVNHKDQYLSSAKIYLVLCQSAWVIAKLKKNSTNKTQNSTKSHLVLFSIKFRFEKRFCILLDFHYPLILNNINLKIIKSTLLKGIQGVHKQLLWLLFYVSKRECLVIIIMSLINSICVLHFTNAFVGDPNTKINFRISQIVNSKNSPWNVVQCI